MKRSKKSVAKTNHSKKITVEDKEKNIRNYMNIQRNSQHAFSFLTAKSKPSKTAAIDASEWIICKRAKDAPRCNNLAHSLTASARNLSHSFITKQKANIPASVIGRIKSEAEQAAATSPKGAEGKQNEPETYKLNIISGTPLPPSFAEKLVFGKYCCDENETFSDCAGEASGLTLNAEASTSANGDKKIGIPRSKYTLTKPTQSSNEQQMSERDTVDDFCDVMRKLALRDLAEDADRSLSSGLHLK
ncbi:uncharacterized protein LOC119689420 [Teleopsis dalmanni]|uniref:uncharacterized protein LOC119689420 n=1 Tax=Teleopsis dalmanni TaxID=139649 RepID=UPI0018CD8DA5|nr:uncharacterized protein LOC119689420 [Teleopsis dalmanni]